MTRNIISALAMAALLFGCTEVTQTIEPSPVDVRVDTGGTPSTAEPTTGNIPGVGSLTLDPPAPYAITVDQTLNVKVIFRGTDGAEAPTENLSATPTNSGIVVRVETDNRIVTFRGVAPGATSILFTANGLATTADITVSP